jgi:hypothetical protein
MPDMAIARILAEANLQPHRSRYRKTATIDAQFTTRAAKMLSRYERGELVLYLGEQPNRHTLVQRVPTQPMQPGRIERHEFEYARHGTVTFLALFNLYDGRI